MIWYYVVVDDDDDDDDDDDIQFDVVISWFHLALHDIMYLNLIYIGIRMCELAYMYHMWVLCLI